MDKIKNPYLPLRDKGYNCFACSPWNDKGLKMEFWEDGDDIVSVWTASEDYQSWTETLHGGIQAALLDEVGGWYVTRKLQTAGVTSTLNIRYRKTVPVGKPLEIRVRLKEMRRNWFAYIMLAPYYLIFLTFTIIPVVVSLVLSFTSFSSNARIHSSSS